MTCPISKDRLENLTASPEFFGDESNFKVKGECYI
jgi:hypothetical protein